MTNQSTSITIDEAIRRFRDHLTACGYPPLTIATYLGDVAYWRTWLTQNSVIRNVSELTKEDITEYLVHLAKEGQGRASPNGNGKQKGLSAVTLKKKLAGLRKFALFLVEQGFHQADITASIKSPRVPKKEPVFLNQQEYKALLYEAQSRLRPRDTAILMTLIQCGLREGELVRLDLADCDLSKRELHLRGRKGGVDTDIPLVEAAVEALKAWLVVRPNVPHSKLFVSSRSPNPLDERAIRYLVKYYMKRAGIRKQASTHTLRHTFGAFKSAKNVDLKTLQYWMGHKRPETTLHYLHLVKKRAPELMEQTAL
jgi:integrase/recombinase XerC